MKIDRLLGITIYLLNHKAASARVLAEEFEVSVRTILRDIETLNLAGIPITSLYGSGGGYKIMENFKLNSQLMDGEDYSYILTALEGLKSGLHNKGIKDTFEKIMHTAADKKMEQNIFLDFSVMHEGISLDQYLELLEKSIIERKVVQFAYTNASHETSDKAVEPIALKYRWYAWYLLGYCPTVNAYRWYKVIRMRNLTLTDLPFLTEHEPAKLIMERLEASDNQDYITILVKCDVSVKVPVEEYLKGEVISENDGYFILRLKEIAKERLWYSLLVGFGDKVEVLEPESLRRKVKKMAHDIYKLYE